MKEQNEASPSKLMRRGISGPKPKLGGVGIVFKVSRHALSLLAAAGYICPASYFKETVAGAI